MGIWFLHPVYDNPTPQPSRSETDDSHNQEPRQPPFPERVHPPTKSHHSVQTSGLTWTPSSYLPLSSGNGWPITCLFLTLDVNSFLFTQFPDRVHMPIILCVFPHSMPTIPSLLLIRSFPTSFPCMRPSSHLTNGPAKNAIDPSAPPLAIRSARYSRVRGWLITRHVVSEWLFCCSL